MFYLQFYRKLYKDDISYKIFRSGKFSWSQIVDIYFNYIETPIY